MSQIKLGQHGEAVAVRFLEKKGYEILERNFKNRLGEIDIVAKHQEILRFVEVKTRQSLTYGQPYESVGMLKQNKLIKLAQSYLHYKFHTTEIPCCFDVVSIHIDSNSKCHIEHIENAFSS